MLIEHENYKRNRYGEILKRESIEVSCDICGERWWTKKEYHKRKKSSIDKCQKCRPMGRDLRKKPKITIKCDACGKSIERIETAISPGLNFCSNACKLEGIMHKYKGYQKSIQDNPNSWAYLCGMVLGDGHARKSGINSTRFATAFDVNWPDLKQIAVKVLETLSIKHFWQPKPCTNAEYLGFVIPDDILLQYSMLWSGNKFDAQPKPSTPVLENVNFAAGLFNTDGHNYVNAEGYERYVFVNTVDSIVRSLEHCLAHNDIDYRKYCYTPKPDKRTGNTPKPGWQIQILKKGAIEKLVCESAFQLKKQKSHTT